MGNRSRNGVKAARGKSKLAISPSVHVSTQASTQGRSAEFPTSFTEGSVNVRLVLPFDQGGQRWQRQSSPEARPGGRGLMGHKLPRLPNAADPGCHVLVNYPTYPGKYPLYIMSPWPYKSPSFSSHFVEHCAFHNFSFFLQRSC